MQINLFNTLTRKEETLKTIDPNHLKMYVCGPTVYDRPHLGNARSVVVYDLFFRLFKQVFPQVTYVRNITDVDDKINAAAKEQKISIQNLTAKITDFFYADIDALNVLRPTHEPRATTHIPEMITMIEQLIANKNAYVSQGHVLFDVASYANYGALSNRQLDEMIAGSRVEIATYKKNPLDFVLWKPAGAEDDASSVFESPWGNGRPGWHIECSAMSSKYLGADFDIHGGGADLQFPHHENEIAQSRCANPNSNYANFWIHNGFLTVEGEKMSKSLKNFITVRDLLDKGVSGVVIRYLLLSTHYRKPFDFNQKALDDATKSLEKFYLAVGEINHPSSLRFAKEGLGAKVLGYLAEDLNISKVIALLHETAKEIKATNSQNLKDELGQTLDFLGLIDHDKTKKVETKSDVNEAEINAQIALRLKAKEEKNFKLADEIRQNMLAKGIVLEDVGKTQTIWKRA
ncbi:MAG: cysteine--tRNA ligase [Rickettsiales bacterium]|nr:cysteine--tRNA ligase [Rickettsiales bacterium]